MQLHPGDLADLLSEFELPGPEAPEVLRFELYGSSRRPGLGHRAIEFRLERLPDGHWAYIANCRLVVTDVDVAIAAEFLPFDDEDLNEREEQLARLEACREALLGLSPALGGS